MNNELLEELTNLRDDLRKIPINGRMPTVCSDAAIAEIVRLTPKNKNDMLFINGLGKAFIEKFGDAFLDIVEKHSNKLVKSNVLTSEVKETLKNLENRLVNINKRNRLLYMPKLSANTTCDLVVNDDSISSKHYNIKLADFIKRFESGKRMIICDTVNDSEESKKKYKQLSAVIRESNRAMRETGENNLYIAYPFVSGKMMGEDFAIRAPLVLLPVEIIKETNSICIKMDTAKDVLFNSSLVLTFFKFNGVNNELPSNIYEEINSFRFYDQITQFYADNGIAIKKTEDGITPFKQYTQATFPKYKSGQFALEESIVLGKFPLYSSALQKDFRDIKNSANINEILNDLLQRYEDVDIYSESIDMGDAQEPLTVSEKNINYINELNFSQEAAIFSINNGTKLVIQGPPGTGKSQTITSLISDFVNKGKNILMVSQKKAALDVIYSRLGNMSKYALFIHDVKNKDSFYGQLEKIFTSHELDTYSQEKFDSVSCSIDSRIASLEKIADKLYYDSKYGVGLYKIYAENIESKFSTESDKIKKFYLNNTPKEFFDIGYLNIKKLSREYNDKNILDIYKKYYDLLNEFPWISQIKFDFTNLEVRDRLKELDSIIDMFVVLQSKYPMERMFTSGKYRRSLKRFVKANFVSYDKKLIKLFRKEPLLIYNTFDSYMDYTSSKVKFDTQNEDGKLFFGVIYNIANSLNCPIININNNISDFAAQYYITEFESQNRDVIETIDSFDIYVREISMNIDGKKELSRERLMSILSKSCNLNIINSKRFADMQRVIESKRKWDVARYINKFNFELFNGIKIWLMTPEVVSEVLPLENGLFDLVIFDEASQIYIEKGIPSLARGKKVVIAGDHKQLRPSSLGVGRVDYDDEADDVDAELNAALEEESLLDLARFKFPEVLLNYHYRSKYEELIAFSNYAFYKGKLNVSPNTLHPKEPPIQVKYVEDGLWIDRTNRQEAEEVVKLIKQVMQNRKEKETMGVITFNSSQRDLVLDLLDEECNKDAEFAHNYNSETVRAEKGEDLGLFVKNIENVQGDERDVIIFSLAYAKNSQGKVIRNFGWLNQTGGENRLNVAISRAKKRVYIVTSVKPSELKVDDLTNEGPRILKKYLEYAYCVSDGDVIGAKDVLHSFTSNAIHTSEYNDEFVLNFAKKLMSAGLIVERNVGIGGYKIDLAIVDSGGKYLLGIECDCNLYNFTKEARERDVHRAKYLTSRGWKIYRLWSPNLWRNPDKEILKIKNLLY